MKTAVLLSVVLTLLTIAAQGETRNAAFGRHDRTCRRDANFAKMLMWQKQHGWSFTDSLDWIDEQLKNDPELLMANDPNITAMNKQILNITAREAYSANLEIFEHEKQRVVTDFELYTYRHCMDLLEQ